MTRTELMPRALLFLTMSVIVGDGTILGYFIFYTKIHVLCLLAVVNSRIGLSESAGGASMFVSVVFDLFEVGAGSMKRLL